MNALDGGRVKVRSKGEVYVLVSPNTPRPNLVNEPLDPIELFGQWWTEFGQRIP